MTTEPDEGTEAGETETDGNETDGTETDREPVEGGVGESEVSSDERTWGSVVHASALVGLFVPFGNVLAPLVVWLIKREESEFVDANGKEALNFQITWTVLLVLALLSVLVGVGVLVAPIVALAWVVLVVLATVRASENEVYDYPLTVDLVS